MPTKKNHKNKAVSTGRKIKVSTNGPYLVSGALPLTKTVIVNDDAGGAQEWCITKEIPTQDTYALCR